MTNREALEKEFEAVGKEIDEWSEAYAMDCAYGYTPPIAEEIQERQMHLNSRHHELYYLLGYHLNEGREE